MEAREKNNTVDRSGSIMSTRIRVTGFSRENTFEDLYSVEGRRATRIALTKPCYAMHQRKLDAETTAIEGKAEDGKGADKAKSHGGVTFAALVREIDEVIRVCHEYAGDALSLAMCCDWASANASTAHLIFRYAEEMWFCPVWLFRCIAHVLHNAVSDSSRRLLGGGAKALTEFEKSVFVETRIYQMQRVIVSLALRRMFESGTAKVVLMPRLDALEIAHADDSSSPLWGFSALCDWIIKNLTHRTETGETKGNYTQKEILKAVRDVSENLFVCRDDTQNIFLLKDPHVVSGGAKHEHTDEVIRLLENLVMRVLKGSASRWCAVSTSISPVLVIRTLAVNLMREILKLYDPSDKGSVHVGKGVFEEYLSDASDVRGFLIDVMSVFHLGDSANAALRTALTTHEEGSKYEFSQVLEKFESRQERAYESHQRVNDLIQFVVGRYEGGECSAGQKKIISDRVFGVRVQLLSQVCAVKMQLVGDTSWLEGIVSLLGGRHGWDDAEYADFFDRLRNAKYHLRDVRQLGIKSFANVWAKRLQECAPELRSSKLDIMFAAGSNLLREARRHSAGVRCDFWINLR